MDIPDLPKQDYQDLIHGRGNAQEWEKGRDSYSCLCRQAVRKQKRKKSKYMKEPKNTAHKKRLLSLCRQAAKNEKANT